MNVVLLLWRVRVRASWRGAIVLVALLGLGGAVALSVAAGARRTASANEAIIRSAGAADVAALYGPQDPRQVEATVRTTDGVADVSLWVGFLAVPPDGRAYGFFSVVGLWTDPASGGQVVLTKGRLPVGPNETMANEGATKALGLAPGDRVEIPIVNDRSSLGAAERVTLDVVGIGLVTDEVIEDELDAKLALFVSREFTEQHLHLRSWGRAGVDVVPGRDQRTVVGALASKGLVVNEFLDEDRERVQDALRPLLVTLAGLSALAGAAIVIVASQALSRLLRRRRTDDASLRAMGCATGQLVAADLLYAAAIAGSGLILAVGTAAAASPLFPVGPTRRARVNQGVDIDLVALGGGAASLFVAVVALVTLGSWRRRTGQRPTEPGRAPRVLASHLAADTGIRLATAQRGGAVALASVAVGLTVLVAAVTFTGSLGRLLQEKSLVGLSWDVGGRAAVPFDSADLGEVRRVVEDDPNIVRATGQGNRIGTVMGRTVPLAVYGAVKGSPWPPLVAGRLPRAKGEVLVGRATLRDLGLEIGDPITVSIPTGWNTRIDTSAVSATFKVVGSAVAPAIGLGGIDKPKLDTGILFSTETVDLPPAAEAFPIVLFDLAEGVEPDTLIARFPDGLAQFDTPPEWFTSATPAEITQAESARTTIWLGVGAMAVAIIGTIVHILLGWVRQRRREYAVLKALGFTRRQVRRTVLCQSGALLGVALVLAVPLGVAAGRWLWSAFANDLGIVPRTATPLLLLGSTVVATLIVVQGAALLPALLAQRTPLAQTLRSE